MEIRVRKIDMVLEKALVTAMIVSTTFMAKVFLKIKREHFKSSYAGTLAGWCIDFYKQYKKAMNIHVRDIFNERANDLGDDEKKLIDTFLSDISLEFAKEKHMNVDYLYTKAREFIKKRTLEILLEKVKTRMDNNEIDKAEKLMEKYQEVAYESDVEVINIFDKDRVLAGWDRIMNEGTNEDPDFLFAFPGVARDFFGIFKRGWLIGIEAPMKRGKSFILQEFATQAVMNKLNVLFITMEMHSNEISNRIYKRIASTIASKQDKILFPVFDCELNQNGGCRRSERTNKCILLLPNKNKPIFEDANPKYKSCSFCRGHELLHKHYKPEVWFELQIPRRHSIVDFKKAITSFSRYSCGDENFKVLMYPSMSTSVEQIKADIGKLELTKGFFPDVVVIDYADLITTETKNFNRRDTIDEVWKKMKGIALEKRCTIVTATQSGRRTFNKQNQKAEDTFEDIRKLAHVDMMFALNQMPQDRKDGSIRIANIVSRWGEVDEEKQLRVLQFLFLGQTYLDAEIIPTPHDQEEDVLLDTKIEKRQRVHKNERKNR